MKKIDQYKVVCIPHILIHNYEKMGIDNNTFITIIKILSLNEDYVSIAEMIEKKIVTRDEISNLLQKNIFKQEQIGTDLVFDINSLYEKIYSADNIQENLTIPNLGEEIRKIFNRNLKNEEIQLMEKWLLKQYSKKDILTACQTAKINNIDNFEYIDKILETRLYEN